MSKIQKFHFIVLAISCALGEGESNYLFISRGRHSNPKKCGKWKLFIHKINEPKSEVKKARGWREGGATFAARTNFAWPFFIFPVFRLFVVVATFCHRDGLSPSLTHPTIQQIRRANRWIIDGPFSINFPNFPKKKFFSLFWTRKCEQFFPTCHLTLRGGGHYR